MPTLVLIGGTDAFYPVPATKQANLLTGTTDVTAVTIPDTGHALSFHRSQDQFQARLSMWLADHRFGGWAMPVGSADTGGGSTAAAGAQPLLLGSGVLLIVMAGSAAAQSATDAGSPNKTAVGGAQPIASKGGSVLFLGDWNKRDWPESVDLTGPLG